jgi:hypothetical protein
VTFGSKSPEGIRQNGNDGQSKSKEPFVQDDKTMKAPILVTKAQNMPTGIRSGVPEETGKNGPSFAEIHERAREIHIERGDHVCDMDNYLDEWLQADRELQEKYNNSSCE